MYPETVDIFLFFSTDDVGFNVLGCRVDILGSKLFSTGDQLLYIKVEVHTTEDMRGRSGRMNEMNVINVSLSTVV